MPARYDSTTGNYEIRCSHCGTSRHTSTPGSGAAALDTQGNLVADFIRWLPARGVFHSWCRSCERAARNGNASTTNRAQARAARNGGRNLTRKFGVELELIFPPNVSRQTIVSRLESAGLSGWRAKGDGSLSGGNGIEVVTPPLSGETGMEQLRTGMRVLREMGAKVNRSCGTHVHHDIRDMNIAGVKRFVQTWANNQDVIDGLVSESRRGASSPFYCKRLHNTEVAKIMRCTTMEQLRSLYIERYRTININSYARFGTIEVRQHQGTVDFEKVRSWIMLGQAMLDGAHNGAQPMTTQPRVRDMLDRVGNWMDETAKTFLLGRAVEFGAVAV